MLWCNRCRKELVVIRGVNEWRIQCQNCIYSRPFGAAKLNAEVSAAKHRMKHPDHVVRIYSGNQFMRQFPDAKTERNQTVIPMTPERDSDIPF